MAMVDWLLLPIGLLALGYALKRLLPASLWARLGGRSPAAPTNGCGSGCNGCAAVRTQKQQ